MKAERDHFPFPAILSKKEVDIQYILVVKKSLLINFCKEELKGDPEATKLNQWSDGRSVKNVIEFFKAFLISYTIIRHGN